MRKFLVLLIVLIGSASAKNGHNRVLSSDNQLNYASCIRPSLHFITNHGGFNMVLFRDNSPSTTDNFLQYVNNGYYNDLKFIIEKNKKQNVVIRVDDSTRNNLFPPILSEAQNGLTHTKYTVAMARNPNDANTATGQFFINLKNNPQFNYQDNSPQGMGYTIFGRVNDDNGVISDFVHGDYPTLIIKKITFNNCQFLSAEK